MPFHRRTLQAAAAGLALLLAFCLPVSAADPPVPAADTPAPPGTWRVDYFHAGGPGLDEVFSLDRVVVEPLPWPGHPAGRVDTAGFGVYRFEVREGEGADAAFLLVRGRRGT